MADHVAVTALQAHRRPGLMLISTCVAVALAGAFMAIGLRGNLAFVLELRGTQLAAFAVVGISIAVSTVVFQTISANFILSPSILGLDALYLFCQTLLVFLLGGFGYAGLDLLLKFGVEALVMVGAAVLLFMPLLRRSVDLSLLLLSGIVLGILFRSLSAFLARVIDPNDFAVLQDASFASFNNVDPNLLGLGALVTGAACLVFWRSRSLLDVMALGRPAAIGLGVPWNATATWMLMLVAAMTAVATALVGPLSFLGLLVVALSERIAVTRRHAVMLPLASLVAVIVLVGGQLVLRHVVGADAVLSIVIEFAGGLVFLILLTMAGRR